MRLARERIAAAPISWGVCEVPQWGHQLPADRVLREMHALDIVATEFGPEGFLPDDPAERATVLGAHDLAAVGGFLPAVLHDPGHDPLPEVDACLQACQATGATVAVLAATAGTEGYDARPGADETGWATLLSNLDRVDRAARDCGVTAAFHPHVGTLVERPSEVERVMTGCGIGLCVDTGHLLVGGSDPVKLTAQYADRVAHVHLKDVDRMLAARVLAGEVSYGDAVWDGLFCPLGSGDLDVTGLVGTLESAGYSGWYVLEQDVRLAGEPADAGPARDVSTSLEFLRRLR